MLEFSSERAVQDVPVDDDTARGEVTLFGNGMRVTVPARSLELRHDVLSAGVGFSGHSLAARWFQFGCYS
jgi:hypothetical protein